MEILLMLIPAALCLSGIGLGLFFWAVSKNQFDDLEGPRWKILYQEERTLPPPGSEQAREDKP